eukprot:3564037-Prymnesium_polylepis.1
MARSPHTVDAHEGSGSGGAVRTLHGCVPTCTPAALLSTPANARAALKDAQARLGPHQDQRSRHGEIVQPRTHAEPNA